MTLFEDLPMQSLRDLARQLEPSPEKRRLMILLRRKAAPEYDEKNFLVLGVLAEVFKWKSKGTFYNRDR